MSFTKHWRIRGLRHNFTCRVSRIWPSLGPKALGLKASQWVIAEAMPKFPQLQMCFALKIVLDRRALFFFLARRLLLVV